jgi:hypothetical protein
VKLLDLAGARIEPPEELRCVLYQMLPLESPDTSWVASSRRGSSYSVITTLVWRPCGRGRVTKDGSFEPGPRTVANHFTSRAVSSSGKRLLSLTLMSGEPAPWVMR